VSRSTAAAAIGLAFVLILAATAAASTPTISYSIDGISGSNGWYRGSTHGDNVVVHWSVSFDATSTNCLGAVTVPGPTTGTKLSCWAQNGDGLTTAVTRGIKIDDTPPTGVTGHATRRPDYHGWYNHPVTVRWTGNDATSGIAHCSSATYRGPDSAAAAVNGGCVDRAGNTGDGQIHLGYDATPPVLGKVTETSTAAGNVLAWSSSSPSDRIVVRRAIRARKGRTTVFDGSAGGYTDKKIHPGAQYVYFVQSFDQAGNGSRVASITGLIKVLTLQKTPYVPVAAPNPILRWHRVGGAAYYNVQLYRGKTRIYAVWPTMHQVGLPIGWRWSGHHFSLAPGRYRWYVWAGFGPRKLASYRAVGNGRFVLPRS